MEEMSNYDGYLLRETRTLKGLLQHPQSISFNRSYQILLIQCDLTIYFISLRNILKGGKQLLMHFSPSDVLSLVDFQIPTTEYTSINFFRTICGPASNSNKRVKVDLEAGEKINVSKEYGKLITFRQAKMKSLGNCKFIAGSLLSSGQLVIMKLKFHKYSISTAEAIEGSYVNDLLINNYKKELVYPYCHSFDLYKVNDVLLIAHFNTGIYLLNIIKRPMRLQVIFKIAEKLPASICVNTKAINGTLHILFGSYDGTVAYCQASLTNLNNPFALVKYKIPETGLALNEPIVQIKIRQNKTHNVSALVCKGQSLFKVRLEMLEMSIEKVYNFTKKGVTIYGFAETYQQLFGCGLNDTVYLLHCSEEDKSEPEEHKLKLIKEGYGVAKSSNGLLLYIIGKGKSEKENKLVIENLPYKEYSTEDVVIIMLNESYRKNRIVDTTDIVQLILERRLECTEIVNLLLALQVSYKGSTTEVKRSEDRVKSLCAWWNTPQTQLFIAKIAYQLLVLGYELNDKSSLQPKKMLELILLKEYIKEQLQEDNEKTNRLLLLYCILAGDLLHKDKILWDKVHEITKNNLTEVKDKCRICQQSISLFVVKTKSIPIKVGTIFPANDLLNGRIVTCSIKHKNTVLLDEVRIKRVGDITYECSTCKCFQQSSNCCFICGSYCYKLP